MGGDTTVPVYPDSVNRCCTRKVLYKRLPILQWLPKYTIGEHGISDLVAGVTVGLTVIPQAIAFANVAGLPPQVSRSGLRIFANRRSISRSYDIIIRYLFTIVVYIDGYIPHAHATCSTCGGPQST